MYVYVYNVWQQRTEPRNCCGAIFRDICLQFFKKTQPHDQHVVGKRGQFQKPFRTPLCVLHRKSTVGVC